MKSPLSESSHADAMLQLVPAEWIPAEERATSEADPKSRLLPLKTARMGMLNVRRRSLSYTLDLTSLKSALPFRCSSWRSNWKPSGQARSQAQVNLRLR